MNEYIANFVAKQPIPVYAIGQVLVNNSPTFGVEFKVLDIMIDENRIDYILADKLSNGEWNEHEPYVLPEEILIVMIERAVA